MESDILKAMGKTLVTMGVLAGGVVGYMMLSNKGKRKAQKLLKEMAMTATDNL